MKANAKLFITVACAGLVAGASGCTLIHARRDLAVIDRAATIEGDVRTESAGEHPIVLFIFNEKEGRKIPRSRYVRYGSGRFHFVLEPDEPAYVFAIEDKNENVAWDDAEPAAWYGGTKAKAIELTPGAKITNLVIELSNETPDGTAELRALQAKGRAAMTRMPAFHEGDITSLDDPRFSRENGAKGLWQPVEFSRQVGYGVYFLEPYDPARIPVLFVHGAGGSPREFAEIIDKLDRTRFQPWIAHYPSGIRLGLIADGMRNHLDAMANRYKFQRLVIVAHSMGGLVSRACINQIVRHPEKQYVAALVTISTPWLGHAMAEAGTQRSPVVLPAWFDLAPTSPFLRDLLSERLPPQIPHHLFFGYEGGRGSDGTVSLESELAPRAQDGAAAVYGFAENHVSILKSPALIAKLNGVLGSLAEPPVVEVVDRLADLRLAVHHERAVLGDRLPQRSAGDQQ